MKLFVIFTFLILPLSAFPNETCSRVATINYQQVLVDAGSQKKGEGLRFYLGKDPISKSLLDDYQEKNKPTLFSAASSTVGSVFILMGLLQSNNTSGFESKSSLLYGGGLLVALSYLTSKTIQYSNERILKEAVDQYNKRNTPRIYFSPYRDNSGNSSIGFGLHQEF